MSGKFVEVEADQAWVDASLAHFNASSDAEGATWKVKAVNAIEKRGGGAKMLRLVLCTDERCRMACFGHNVNEHF